MIFCAYNGLAISFLHETIYNNECANNLDQQVQKVEDDDDEKEEWEMQKQADEQVRLKVSAFHQATASGLTRFEHYHRVFGDT